MREGKSGCEGVSEGGRERVDARVQESEGVSEGGKEWM